MSVKRRWFYNFFAGFALVLAAIIWVLFAPVRLGGQNEYIIINGNSMEPAIKTGDLIILRKADAYQVGDAVAYRSPSMKNVVFHRIIGMELDHYIFQGDHNDWVDSYKPTFSELAGKQWIYIPNAGKVVEWVRKPLFAGLLVAVCGGIILGFLLKKSKKKKIDVAVDPISRFKERIVKTWDAASRSKNAVPKSAMTVIDPLSTAEQNKSRQNLKAREINGAIEVSFFVFGLFALAFLALGAFAFFNPLTRLTTEDYPYRQKGNFSYTAPAPAGVYDSQTVQSGDPVFTKLTCKMNLLFNYVIGGEGLQNLSGTHQLTAVLSDPVSGWTRTLPLEQPQTFTQDIFTSQVLVDLCQMQTITKEMEAQTGMSLYNYSLAINPNVVISGQIQNTDLNDTFTTPLVFQLDAVRASMVKSDPQADPLNPTKDGLAQYEFIGPNSLTILNNKLPVVSARTISAVGFVISLLGLAGLLMIISRTSKRSREMLVRMKYGSSMVDVESSDAHLSRPSVDVKDIDDLARLAERNNTVILHEARGWLHTYLVEADQVTYRYTLNEVQDNPINGEQRSDSVSALNLQQGITNGEFKVYYQPIVSILDKHIIAVEALLRWQHPQNGLMSANEFISQAETTGLIDVLGEWVLQEASRQVKEWRKDNNPLRLAVNFSRRQIEKHPARLISQVLERTGLGLDALQIEVSENSLLQDPELIYKNLVEMQKMGVHLSVDGYTGDSSLTNLQQLPFESIKIGRNLIMKLDQPREAEYVQGIISAALDRGLSVVAEGVENRFQMNVLRSQYCNQAQGFLIARPAPADEISALLAGE
jgi:signal peptidase I